MFVKTKNNFKHAHFTQLIYRLIIRNNTFLCQVNSSDKRQHSVWICTPLPAFQIFLIESGNNMHRLHFLFDVFASWCWRQFGSVTRKIWKLRTKRKDPRKRNGWRRVRVCEYWALCSVHMKDPYTFYWDEQKSVGYKIEKTMCVRFWPPQTNKIWRINIQNKKLYNIQNKL